MDFLNAINDFLWTWILIAVLLCGGIYFTVRLGGTQFRMIWEMLRLLFASGHRHDDAADRSLPPSRSISSFPGFHGFAGESGGYRKHCRCSDSHSRGRTRCRVLDVGGGDNRIGQRFRRVDARTAFQGERRPFISGWPCILYSERP